MLKKLMEQGSHFLGVKYPIISGGMTWISNFELVKAVSESGGFPVLAAGNMPPDLFEQEVDRCVADLDKPFAVNLITIAPFYKEHMEIIETKDVPFVVFAANIPKKPAVQKMKAAGKKTMAFASTKSIADQMIRYGIDALILEGSEAGGHIGHVSLTILLQQVLFEVRGFPVFVAGGLATGRMMAHVLAMGAYGCQFGTLFAMSEECTAHDDFKEALRKARARQAISTPQYNSKLPVVAVRALRNEAMDRFSKLQVELLEKMERGELHREEAQYEVEKFWVGGLRKAVQEGDVSDGSVMAGQSVGLVNQVRPMREIIRSLVTEAETELGYLKNLLDQANN